MKNLLKILKKDITNEIADIEYQKLEKVVGELGSDTNINIWKEMRKAFPTEVKTSSHWSHEF